ncbi:MAG: methylglyoxal synthase [Flavobacteriaceae bacterium]|nr:methylglyoxal synthase [Flavobacteriaceae bacterium]MCY4267707.1 methylglyoxal synthase [Flavobacteriaceae bacterium]MCY4299096.1 methylglyoxal synthase [Flavobacteriaceae bacterium]
MQSEFTLKKIALIAHDNKKPDMVSFVTKRLKFFNHPKIKVVATGTTAYHCERAGIRKVEKVASGPYGGDAEIAAMVTRNEISVVIFMRDPLGKHPHDVDISMLMRVCDVHGVSLATNYETANLLIDWYSQNVLSK